MLIVKVKHGRRKYTYGGRGVISNILNSPIAQKLAAAAITGAVKGLHKVLSENDNRSRSKIKYLQRNKQIESSTDLGLYRTEDGFFNY